MFYLYEGHVPDLRFNVGLDFDLPPIHKDLLKVKGDLVSIDIPRLPVALNANNQDDLTNIATTAFIVVNLRVELNWFDDTSL